MAETTETTAEPDTPSLSPSPEVLSPAAVQPGKPVVRGVARATARDDHVARPDDVDCPACVTANPAGRSFCRHCGASLAPSAASARVGWWRRRWQAWRRRRISRRRQAGGRLGRLLTRLVALAVAASVAWAGVAYGPRVVNSLRDRFTPPSPMHAVSVRASSEAPGHPAAAAVDGTLDHFWAPVDPPSGPPVGAWLEADFAQPFHLLDLVFNSGASAQEDEFLKQARPAEVEITASLANGGTVQKTVRLEDRPAAQTVQLPIPGVKRIRLTLRSVYGMAPSRAVALAEVEFFQR